MNDLTIRLRSGASLVVPASLGSITTYILLEQEAWFEKEADFLMRWLRPGMSVIDIGANLGVYSLPLARRVGPHGMVFAYEPGSEPRSLLERSRAVNRADNLHVIAAAMSDRPREGKLVLGTSSELNSLEGTGPTENVWISSLDAEDVSRGWASIDFIKIDAEGEEERILDGGKAFFRRHSPLVMFEIKAAHGINEVLRSAFRERGYAVYRLLDGAPVLVPDRPGETLDPYEVNLLAAKPDRAAALARDGFLVESLPDWAPDERARGRALEVLRAQPFAADFGPIFADGITLDPLYRDGLAGYATWRSPEVPLPERCAALDFAFRTLVAVCNAAPSLARLSSAARAAADAGQRMVSLGAVLAFGKRVVRGGMDLTEPFWPATARFDRISPGAKRAEWLLVSAFEQVERASAYSSWYVKSNLDLDWLCAQPFVSAEMERRRVLARARANERVEVPVRLCAAAEDHLNADVWAAGLVPNTFIRDIGRVTV